MLGRGHLPGLTGLARLTFVRHAQGSILGPDYDVLTPLGREQADRLGAWWRASVDQVFVGPAGRHQTTHELARRSLRGVAWPSARTIDDMDEHDAKSLVRGVVSKYGPTDAGLMKTAAAIGDTSASQQQRSGAVQVLFETIMGRWLDGEYAIDGVETWPEFQTRVDRGLDQMLAAIGRGQHAIVVSSVGPCAVALARAGQMEPHRAFSTAWRLFNTGVCEFVTDGESLTLESFNSRAHLPSPRLWTHR